MGINILIVSGRFGLGHLSAAQAIEEALAREFPQARVDTVDFLRYATGSDRIYKAFELLVSHGRGIFNRLYYRSEQEEERIGVPFKAFCFRAFGRLLEERRPQVVVSTLPFTTQLAGQYRASGRGRYILINCVTDTAVHADWVAPAVDAYLAACPDTRRALVEAGVEDHRIFVTGVPVRGEFYPAERDGRPGDARELLVLGGGLGLMSQDMDFYAQLDALPQVHTTVACGCNEKLLAALEGRFEHVTALGFTGEMGALMRRADLALGKPGGSTLFEAVACHLPFLSPPPFLAQEQHNAEFIRRYGLGWVLEREVEESVEIIRHTLWDERGLARARACMARLEAGFDRETLASLIRLAIRAA